MSEQQQKDHLHVLRALTEIPFGVGKTLLTDFLQGQDKNQSIRRNLLDIKPSFGTLAYQKTELQLLIEQLISAQFIVSTSVPGKPYCKVLALTEKGKDELRNPTFSSFNEYFQDTFQTTTITEEDKKLFTALGSFLDTYNETQKKAITSGKQKILCVAGAGSGKTTVLTKRIQFLTSYRSVDPRSILAITFTRKARAEMRNRLENMGLGNKVHVETFNSFSEKMLRTHAHLLYDNPMRVITYKDKIQIVTQALKQAKISSHQAISLYFNRHQQKAKSPEQLFHTFVNDCFFIRDYFKSKHKRFTSSTFLKPGHRWTEASKLVYSICTFIQEYLENHGLRDFMDQILDTIHLFKTHPETIPPYTHVLVDEYQDVNASQIEILNLLKPENLFCVGDPRQAIYGWRGSDINYILNFAQDHPDAETIMLTKNYRSLPSIVNLGNSVIEPLGLPSLDAVHTDESRIHLLECASDEDEFSFIVQKILSTQLPLHEIFVLSRTNKQLTELSKRMRHHGIPHLIRSEETQQSQSIPQGMVILATVHAIKGLEADHVFVLGTNGANFPCRGGDHPVIDMVTVDEYNKIEEERRVFYVGITRAKRALFLTYTGKQPTSFLSEQAQKHLQFHTYPRSIVRPNTSEQKQSHTPSLRALTEWRESISKRRGVKPYQILSNTILHEIAQQQPSSFKDLEEIAGLSPAKIIKYGDQIISALHPQ